MEMNGRNQLAVDIINGVYVCENPSDKATVLFDNDFYEALEDCREDEILYGNVSDEIAEKIQNEYGIL